MDTKINFHERYSSFSDGQLNEVLRNHKNYQESAIKAAVEIAIERGLIHSEQDLLAPEYQLDRSVSLSFFPEITNAYLYKKVTASIFRILFFLSLLPISFGVIKYAKGQLDVAIFAVILGLIWIILTYILLKTKKLILLLFQVYLLAFVFFGILYLLLIQKPFHAIDVIVLVGGTVIPLYFLLYLKKLIQTKPDSLTGQ